MGENELFILIGLPYSGKTTWAKKQGYPIVNPDSIRLALHGQRFAKEAELYVWAIARTMVESLFLAGHDKVILDACNNTTKRQQAWADGEWKITFHRLDVAADVCISRAKHYGDDKIIPVIERMAAEQESEK